MTEAYEPVEIAVAGGSIAGLCAGNALFSAGFDVHVFERSAGRLASRGAGIVVQPELLGLLAAVDAPALATTSCSVRRTLDGVDPSGRTWAMPQQFTAWEAIYSALIAAFPGERYHAGAALEVERSQNSGVTARAGDRAISSEVLIAADGFRSAARKRFAPQTVTRYAGYVAWRGVVDERDLAPNLGDFFDDAFTFCNVAEGGHALCYFIPGEGLATERGSRRLNWVWYVTVPEGPELDALMTDRDGRRRDAAVPQGLVNGDALHNLKTATRRLDPRFADVVRCTERPFIQAIVDVVPPSMVFGRVCLLGDAAFVVRPHTAAAAAKAAADAAALGLALSSAAPDYERALQVWEARRMAVGKQLTGYGMRLGERSRMFGVR
ncbi:MAG: FAD-dependent monooxygenase [Pseudomonadota bacterium]